MPDAMTLVLAVLSLLGLLFVVLGLAAVTAIGRLIDLMKLSVW